MDYLQEIVGKYQQFTDEFPELTKTEQILLTLIAVKPMPVCELSKMLEMTASEIEMTCEALRDRGLFIISEVPHTYSLIEQPLMEVAYL